MKTILIASAVLSSGCAVEGEHSESSRTFCRTRPIGDMNRSPELDLLVVHPDGTERPLHDGSSFALSGTSARLTVHARNLDGCGVAVRIASQSLGGAAESYASAGLMLELTHDGEWGVPPRSPSSAVEIPMSPDRTHRLVVAVEDADARSAIRTMRVTPHSE